MIFHSLVMEEKSYSNSNVSCNNVYKLDDASIDKMLWPLKHEPKALKGPFSIDPDPH